MSGDRHDLVVARLRTALQEDARLAMLQTDVNARFAELGVRLHKDRVHRSVRAIAVCLAFLAALAAAVAIVHRFAAEQPLISPPGIDRGGPRLDDPNAKVPRPLQTFNGQGRRFLAQGFGPEFSFVEPPAPWRIAGPEWDDGLTDSLGRPEWGALYLVRGDSNRSTQRLTFLIWRNVLDDSLRPSLTPPDLVSWLASNTHLANASVQADTVSGMPTVQLDAGVASVPSYEGPAQYCSPPLTRCLLIADNAESFTQTRSGIYREKNGPRAAYLELRAHVRFWIVTLPNGDQLVIHASAQPADFEVFIGEAEQIVQSLVIAR